MNKLLETEGRVNKEEQLKILVIDDDHSMRRLLSQKFSEFGHNVYSVETGLLAFEYLQDHEVDVVILDYNLPQMDGVQVMGRLNINYPNVPVIMITVHSNISLVEQFMNAGGAGFVEKPFDVNMLDAKIWHIIDKWRLKNIMNKHADLRRALQTLTQLFGSGVHEIRTALTVIEQRTRFLRSKVKSNEDHSPSETQKEKDTSVDLEQKSHIDIIDMNVKRLLNLVEDLMDFSRIESGNLGAITKVNLNDVAKEAIQEVGGLLEEKPSVKLLSNLAPQLPPILGNGKRLFQILSNLLTNAMKFTLKGSICVQTSFIPESQEVELCVRDTGIGISPDNQPFIFDKFTEFTVSSLMAGSGLGLSITQLLTQKMNGKINFVSEEGVGTTFFLRFPGVRSSNE